jgi:hypothetical protein
MLLMESLDDKGIITYWDHEPLGRTEARFMERDG